MVIHHMARPVGLFILLLLSLPMDADGVILLGVGNTGNLTDPGNGLPFDAVARAASSPGHDGSGGSAVHLGGGYMLTAAHINNSELNSVTFDGSTFYTRDLTYLPTQIGTSDMKVFKLSAVPSAGAASLYTGSAELLHSSYLVGWGRRRAEPVSIGSTIIPIAGGGTPLQKRWGTNQPKASISNFTYSSYTFDALQTVLGADSGSPAGNGIYEAAATPRDSGSGLFQQIGGNWYLTGITSLILQQNSGSVTYGDDSPWTGASIPGLAPTSLTPGDPNYFVKISSYHSTIQNLLPVPEPSCLALLAVFSLVLSSRRRRLS